MSWFFFRGGSAPDCGRSSTCCRFGCCLAMKESSLGSTLECEKEKVRCSRKGFRDLANHNVQGIRPLQAARTTRSITCVCVFFSLFRQRFYFSCSFNIYLVAFSLSLHTFPLRSPLYLLFLLFSDMKRKKTIVFYLLHNECVKSAAEEPIFIQKRQTRTTEVKTRIQSTL